MKCVLSIILLVTTAAVVANAHDIPPRLNEIAYEILSKQHQAKRENAFSFLTHAQKLEAEAKLRAEVEAAENEELEKIRRLQDLRDTVVGRHSATIARDVEYISNDRVSGRSFAKATRDFSEVYVAGLHAMKLSPSEIEMRKNEFQHELQKQGERILMGEAILNEKSVEELAEVFAHTYVQAIQFHRNGRELEAQNLAMASYHLLSEVYVAAALSDPSIKDQFHVTERFYAYAMAGSLLTAILPVALNGILGLSEAQFHQVGEFAMAMVAVGTVAGVAQMKNNNPISWEIENENKRPFLMPGFLKYFAQQKRSHELLRQFWINVSGSHRVWWEMGYNSNWTYLEPGKGNRENLEKVMGVLAPIAKNGALAAGYTFNSPHELPPFGVAPLCESILR